MKIDANSDGTVDWSEFIEYMLLENKDIMDAVALELLERETLDESEVVEIMDRVKSQRG